MKKLTIKSIVTVLLAAGLFTTANAFSFYCPNGVAGIAHCLSDNNGSPSISSL